jgi:VanZ family protein
MLRRCITLWFPLFFWMVVIFGASTSLGSPQHTSRFIRPFLLWLDPRMSDATINSIHFVIRKSAHVTEYAILGILIWRVVHYSSLFAAKGVAQHFRLALLCAALYAVTDETHQIFVPGREAAVHDVLLDTCGAAAGLAVTWCVLRWRTAKKFQ